MNFVKILLSVVIVAMVSSCGLRNKLRHKVINKSEQVIKVESDETQSSVSSSNVVQQEVDKGTVVTERESTTVTKGEEKSKVSIRKGDIKAGENFIKDSAGNMVKAILDTLNKTLTIEMSIPTITENKVVERIFERKNTVIDRKEERKDSTTKQVASAVEVSRRNQDKLDRSESKPNIWGRVAIIGILIFVVGVVFWVRKR